ncbi:MAG: methylenetetrahydrofolate reductase, partial [Mailhella sp.]|nr:methylenetetrahydrofolate reductase [Mailhella sp.]
MRISDKIHACKSPFYSLEFFPPKNSEDLPQFYETVKRLKTM